METPPHNLPELPDEPVQRWTAPLARFMHIEAASGLVLLVCTVTALVLANSAAWSDWYLGIWDTKFMIGWGDHVLKYDLKHWINDGLMAIFFFVIGLEVKRELVTGELREFRKAALPIAAAIGGMVVPALVFVVYIATQPGQPGMQGWGIPMATDIAFVVGCMAIMGSRAPRSLRIMLLSLAIVDDIGAILVIALFYSDTPDPRWLAAAAGAIAAILFFARFGVRSIGVYVVVGSFAWLAFHESGIHATIAGVILGLITPARSWVSGDLLTRIVGQTGDFLSGQDASEAHKSPEVLRHMERASREAIPPLERLETFLHPWVGFAIMPIFALANAGVKIDNWDSLTSPVAVAVALGLLVGKPAGIVLCSWLAIKSGVASLPEGVNWGQIAAGGFLAGIGFTMALFIASLALEGSLLVDAKIGVLCGSALSAILGIGLLAAFGRPAAETEPARQ